jgi:hypothetical protein
LAAAFTNLSSSSVSLFSVNSSKFLNVTAAKKKIKAEVHPFSIEVALSNS